MTAAVYHPPSESTHFLISGGGKGVTAACAVALASAYHCSFTLLGRSRLLAEEPGWAQGVEDEAALKGAAVEYFQSQGQKVTPPMISREVNQVLSSREIQQTLGEIRIAGGKAEYVSADITNLADLKEGLADSIPSINGVLHGAGALADKYIEDKTENDFELVYGVKVGGLKNILALIPYQQLDYLVLFSSVAGFSGNAGQADYSLSNEVLNKLAHHLKVSRPDCQILSLDWGPWDGGMVTPQLKRILSRRNVPLISLDEGAAALVELLREYQPHPQHIIGSPLPYPPQKTSPDLLEYRIVRDLSLDKNPFLADHVIGGSAVLPTVFAVNWFINSCLNLYPGYQFYAVMGYQVFKGIVFEAGARTEYELDLREVEKNGKAIAVDGRISSQGEGGRKIWHYQARVELRKDIPAPPFISTFDLHDDSIASGKSLYGSQILFHGPSFQGIDRVLNISPDGLTTSCILDPESLKAPGQFRIRFYNPFLADVHLQSMLVWAHLQAGTLGLPLKIASGIQYREAPLGIETYATMKVRSFKDHGLVADVISHDREGLVYMEVSGAEITLNKKLYELFQDNQLESEPAWT
jgi:NAD(P)-dependent dehydrogenase (short-subunit alcohol dehydrogenase family)